MSAIEQRDLSDIKHQVFEFVHFCLFFLFYVVYCKVMIWHRE